MEQGLNVEVDEQTGRCSLKVHVGHQLGGMNRQQLFDRLYLYDKGIFNQQVYAIRFADLYSYVFQWQGDLAGMRNFAKLKLATKAAVVTGF